MSSNNPSCMQSISKVPFAVIVAVVVVVVAAVIGCRLVSLKWTPVIMALTCAKYINEDDFFLLVCCSGNNETNLMARPKHSFRSLPNFFTHYIYDYCCCVWWMRECFWRKLLLLVRCPIQTPCVCIGNDEFRFVPVQLQNFAFGAYTWNLPAMQPN